MVNSAFCHSGASWKALLLLEQQGLEKEGKKYDNFYILKTQVFMLHKPELLMPKMWQSGSRLLIRSTHQLFRGLNKVTVSATNSWQNHPNSPANFFPLLKRSCFTSCRGCAQGHLCGLFGKSGQSERSWIPLNSSLLTIAES